PRASEDVNHNDLWLRFPDAEIWPDTKSGGLRILGGAEARLLISSPTPLTRLAIHLEPPATPEIEVRGAEVGGLAFRPDGGVSAVLELDQEPIRHAMWWTREPQFLYMLRLRLPDAPARPVPFSLRRL
ncbi:MAG: hypothetical protein KDD11_17605, partial [Acidobacteria bacterium]|nr:hypothetical protein [Acidobacteriota bacterium]